jgi:hypothetical protein
MENAIEERLRQRGPSGPSESRALVKHLTSVFQTR